jgi:hypothetical protein
MKPTRKRNRPKPYDEMSTTGALSRVPDGPRPKPYDEMSTTGALSQSSDVTRSLRPIARPERQGATTEGLNPAKSSLRPIARPARKPTADQQELIDYVDDLKVRIRSNVPTTGPRPVEVNERTPIGKPRTMGERMREAGAREQRPAKKFKDGGKVKGFPDLNKDGKVTKADIMKGRGVEGFAEGGMVRGCKPGQSSGTKFTGTF